MNDACQELVQALRVYVSAPSNYAWKEVLKALKAAEIEQQALQFDSTCYL